VYEARTRAGGRVLSMPDVVNGKVVEGGGEFIGANHPTWAAYKKQFGFDYSPVTEDKRARRSSLAEKSSKRKPANACWPMK
jgi:monoamine oxidase